MRGVFTNQKLGEVIFAGRQDEQSVKARICQIKMM